MAQMCFDYLKQITQLFQQIKLDTISSLSIIMKGYEQLSEKEKRQYCEWVMNIPQPRGLRATMKIIDNAHNMSDEEINKIVDAFV